MPSSIELLTSLLQFFAMSADEQLEYAKGIPSSIDERNFPFGLDHSPLVEMVNGVYNIARNFSAKGASLEAIEALEDFEELIELIRTQRLDEAINWTADSLRNSPKWRIARKLSRVCLQKLAIPSSHPRVAYEELLPLVMD